MRQKKSQAAYFMKVLISILFTIYINNSFSQELKPISKFYYFETEIMRLKSNETLNKGVLAFIPTLEKIVLLVDSINYEEEELNKLNLQLNSPPITSSFEKNKKLLEKSLEIISNPEGFELEALDSIYIKFYEIRKRMLKSIRSQIVLSKEIIEAKTSKKNNSDRIEIIKNEQFILRKKQIDLIINDKETNDNEKVNELATVLKNIKVGSDLKKENKDELEKLINEHLTKFKLKRK